MPAQSRLRILFLTQVFPYPLVGGAKIRAYYMLRYLAERHQVTLVSFVRDDDGQEEIDHLRQFCHAVHTIPMSRSYLKNGRSLLESLARGQPLIIVRDRLPEMETMLQGLAETTSFDVIHADQTSMAQYALFARDASDEGIRPRILLDQHNALYLVVRRQARYERGRLKRLLWTREARLLSWYESTLLREFDEVLTVTANDREALLDLLDEQEGVRRGEHITVVPICVDPANQSLLPRKESAPKIIHLGTMFWPPNIEGVLWFAKEILPRVVTAVPDAAFVVAGKNPPQEIRALTSSASPLSAHVHVTGFVADPDPLLASSQVFVVPLLAGGGMRVKILDAWQWGLPVVSTTIGAEGILKRPGENILLADEPQAFADAVIRVLTEPELADRLRRNGRGWVEQHYDWNIVYKNLDAIYRLLEPAPA
jgi:glycosyltransferase involved in cell wall biosynthesis